MLAGRLAANRELAQDRERHGLEHRAVSAGEDHLRRAAGEPRLLPAFDAEAPAIARPQPRKSEFRARRGQIIAAPARKGEELLRHPCTDRVPAPILRPGVAAAVAIESRHRIETAGLQPLAEDVDALVLVEIAHSYPVISR